MVLHRLHSLFRSPIRGALPNGRVFWDGAFPVSIDFHDVCRSDNASVYAFLLVAKVNHSGYPRPSQKRRKHMCTVTINALDVTRDCANSHGWVKPANHQDEQVIIQAVAREAVVGDEQRVCT